MRKRIAVYIVITLAAILGAYIYLGMNMAQRSDQTTEIEVTSKEDLTPLERLQNAGAMTEEQRLEMVKKLQSAEQ